MSIFGKMWSYFEKAMLNIRLFIESTAEEMRKSSWPARDQLLESTLLVLVTLVIMAAFVAGVDQVLFFLIKGLISGKFFG